MEDRTKQMTEGCAQQHSIGRGGRKGAGREGKERQVCSQHRRMDPVGGQEGAQAAHAALGGTKV